MERKSLFHFICCCYYISSLTTRTLQRIQFRLFSIAHHEIESHLRKFSDKSAKENSCMCRVVESFTDIAEPYGCICRQEELNNNREFFCMMETFQVNNNKGEVLIWNVNCDTYHAPMIAEEELTNVLKLKAYISDIHVWWFLMEWWSKNWETFLQQLTFLLSIHSVWHVRASVNVLFVEEDLLKLMSSTLENEKKINC